MGREGKRGLVVDGLAPPQRRAAHTPQINHLGAAARHNKLKENMLCALSASPFHASITGPEQESAPFPPAPAVGTRVRTRVPPPPPPMPSVFSFTLLVVVSGRPSAVCLAATRVALAVSSGCSPTAVLTRVTIRPAGRGEGARCEPRRCKAARPFRQCYVAGSCRHTKAHNGKKSHMVDGPLHRLRSNDTFS